MGEIVGVGVGYSVGAAVVGLAGVGLAGVGELQTQFSGGQYGGDELQFKLQYASSIPGIVVMEWHWSTIAGRRRSCALPQTQHKTRQATHTHTRYLPQINYYRYLHAKLRVCVRDANANKASNSVMLSEIGQP